MNTDLNEDILFSTRQWEFAVDQIRLSSITNAHFFRFLKHTFEFERVEMDHVPQVDGSLQRKSWPPGIVCEFGVIPHKDQPLAIRKLGISATRVLVEAGGTSDHAQIVFENLQEVLDGVTIPSGAPVLGAPRSSVDFSVIVFTAPTTATSIIAPGQITAQLSTMFNLDSDDISAMISFRRVEASQTVDTAQLVWELKPRFETHVSERRFESSARLSSDEHLTLLHRSFGTPDQ